MRRIPKNGRLSSKRCTLAAIATACDIDHHTGSVNESDQFGMNMFAACATPMVAIPSDGMCLATTS